MNTIKNWEELTLDIRKKVDEALAEDILQRFNNSEYHNGDIITEVLAENGYQLEK